MENLSPKKGIYMKNVNSEVIENEFPVAVPFLQEDFLIAKRQHKFVLFTPLCIAVVLFFTFTIIAGYLFMGALHSFELFLVSELIISIIFLDIIAKVLVDWYLHAYIVTSHKILEVRYSPFASDTTNEVLMDQVKCTEVDVHTHGILNQIIGMGDVSLTFDRPTHQQEFVFSNIYNYRDVGRLMSSMFDNSARKTEETTTPMWYKSKDKEKKWGFTEIYSRGGSPAV